MSDTPLDAKGLIREAKELLKLAFDGKSVSRRRHINSAMHRLTAAEDALAAHSSAFTQGVEMMREAAAKLIEESARSWPRQCRAVVLKDAAAIRSLPATDSGNVPAGEWAFVPREPTEAMRHAGVEALDSNVPGHNDGMLPGEVYRAMLAASPLPPSQEPGHGG